MSKPSPVLTPHKANKRRKAPTEAERAQWLADVIDVLRSRGWNHVADKLENCGKFAGNFQIVVCSTDITHKPKPVPLRCEVPGCPNCEPRNHMRRADTYVPKFEILLERAPALFGLKHIVVTHPAALTDSDRVYRFDRMRKFVKRYVNLIYLYAFEHELTPDERRRGRFDPRKHVNGLGEEYAAALAAIEYGEHGHKLHAHIAAILPYIDQKVLSELWRKATYGEAFIVYVKQHKQSDPKKLIQEVVKYATKPVALPAKLMPNLLEVLQGKKRRKPRIAAYGALRRVTLEKKPCTCKICAEKLRVDSALTRIHLDEYFKIHLDRNIPVDAEIVALAPAELRNAYAVGLQFIRRAKDGEAVRPLDDDPEFLHAWQQLNDRLDELRRRDQHDPELKEAWEGVKDGE